MPCARDAVVEQRRPVIRHIALLRDGAGILVFRDRAPELPDRPHAAVVREASMIDADVGLRWLRLRRAEITWKPPLPGLEIR